MPNQPVTLAQHGINIMFSTLSPARRQAGADQGNAGGLTCLQKRIAPGVEAGETAGLFGKVRQRMSQGPQTGVQGFGVDRRGINFSLAGKAAAGFISHVVEMECFERIKQVESRCKRDRVLRECGNREM